MEKSEILEMAIRELTENAINKRKETLDDKEQQLYPTAIIGTNGFIKLFFCHLTSLQ